jgi:hypothetical protein
MERFLSNGNNLANHYPEVAAEWDCKRNGDRVPARVTPYSNYKAHWSCNKCGAPLVCHCYQSDAVGLGLPQVLEIKTEQMNPL